MASWDNAKRGTRRATVLAIVALVFWLALVIGAHNARAASCPPFCLAAGQVREPAPELVPFVPRTPVPYTAPLHLPVAHRFACIAAKLTHPAGETRVQRIARVLRACRP